MPGRPALAAPAWSLLAGSQGTHWLAHSSSFQDCLSRQNKGWTKGFRPASQPVAKARQWVWQKAEWSQPADSKLWAARESQPARELLKSWFFDSFLMVSPVFYRRINSRRLCPKLILWFFFNCFPCVLSKNQLWEAVPKVDPLILFQWFPMCFIEESTPEGCALSYFFDCVCLFFCILAGLILWGIVLSHISIDAKPLVFQCKSW